MGDASRASSPPPTGRLTNSDHPHWCHIARQWPTQWCLWSWSAVGDVTIIDQFVKWSR